MERIKEIVGNYISDNKVMTNGIIEEIIYLLTQDRNLSEYIKRINIGDKYFNSYSFRKRRIKFNRYDCRRYSINRYSNLTKLLSEKERKTNTIDNPNAFNILNLIYINHAM